MRKEPVIRSDDVLIDRYVSPADLDSFQGQSHKLLIKGFLEQMPRVEQVNDQKTSSNFPMRESSPEMSPLKSSALSTSMNLLSDKKSSAKFTAGSKVSTIKRLAASDLFSLQSKLSKLSKKATTDISRAADQHKVIFDWCLKSSNQMLQAMSYRHQKQFLRKLSDQVIGMQCLDLNTSQVGDWAALKETSDKFGDFQGRIDKTLDEIRTLVIERDLEADQLLDKYNHMLKSTD